MSSRDNPLELPRQAAPRPEVPWALCSIPGAQALLLDEGQNRLGNDGGEVYQTLSFDAPEPWPMHSNPGAAKAQGGCLT